MEEDPSVGVPDVGFRLPLRVLAVEMEVAVGVGDEALRYRRVEAPGQKMDLVTLLLLCQGMLAGGRG
jgi:hypothetical protein